MKSVFMAMALMAAFVQNSVSSHTKHGVDETTAITILHYAVPQLVIKGI